MAIEEALPPRDACACAAHVLAFDTANEVIAIGLGALRPAERAVDLVASVEIEARRASNTQLLPRIDEVLARAGVPREDLACVVVGRGPGSFTGVRIAMATAKGIASALELPLVGVSSLDAVAWNVQEEGVRGSLAVVADAMRKEVYPVRYLLDDAGIERLEADRVVRRKTPRGNWRRNATCPGRRLQRRPVTRTVLARTKRPQDVSARAELAWWAPSQTPTLPRRRRRRRLPRVFFAAMR